ncbi:ribosome-binding protein 1-like [Leucoraja erinacea]|uniref:ribosome-binding protein 1-like n=1 Tax=Leucoraja erinaceus TaxID=7782 RepID=UPI002457F45D|nr:ribosome-binding protein 1-like [Leucoraja erinacea]XP_055495069.1 ribosome-binding protein 1-like [Leucoraja erinacea]
MEDHEKYQRNFEEATLPHFLKGISNLLSLLEFVVNAPSGELSDSMCEDIKGEVEGAHTGTLAAEEAAGTVVGLVDKACEELTSQRGRLSKRQDELQADLASTQEQLEDLAARREQAEGQVQSAAVWLKQAKQSLAAARAKRGEKRTGRDIGIGLSFVIPCIGIPMAVAFEKEHVYRKLEVEEAWEEVCQVTASIKKNKEEMNRIDRRVPELEKEVEKATETLSRVKEEMSKIRQLHISLGSMQCNLRNCFQYLSTLHGLLRVMNVQSQNLYSLDQLVPLIVEACEHVQQQVAGNEFLLTATQVHTVLHSIAATLHSLQESKQAQTEDQF